MRLPDIDYGPVQRSSSSFDQIDDAQRRAAQTITAGLDALGRETVRTRMEAAKAKVAAGLADVETELERQPALDKKFVRDRLGDSIGELHQDVRAQLEGEGTIPTYEVAGALHAKAAKDLVAAAGEEMGIGSGWKAEFEAGAQEHVRARRARVEQAQLRSRLVDLRKTQDLTTEGRIRAGQWTEALQGVTESTAFDPAERQQRIEAIELAQQKRPFEDLVLKGVESTQDVVEAGKLIGRLESGEGLPRMEEKDRIQWKHALEAQVREFEHQAKTADANRFREADEAARNGLLGAYIQAGGRQLSMKLVPTPGTVSADTLQWSIRLVESTRPDKKPIETDLRAYSELTGMATSDPEKFKGLDLAPYFSRLAVPDAKHFLDLQRTLKLEGPNSVKYTSFFGPQEETNTRLLFHGLHVTGKDAEDDAFAVGYVQREVNRALFSAAREKAGRGSAAPLSPAEQTAIVNPLVDRLVNAKAWEAEGKGTAIPPDFQPAIRNEHARSGLGMSAKDQETTYRQAKAWEFDITAGWNRSAGGRELRPEDVVGVYALIRKNEAQIRASLKKAGRITDDKPNSTAVADMAVRAYLQGAR